VSGPSFPFSSPTSPKSYLRSLGTTTSPPINGLPSSRNVSTRPRSAATRSGPSTPLERRRSEPKTDIHSRKGLRRARIPPLLLPRILKKREMPIMRVQTTMSRWGFPVEERALFSGGTRPLGNALVTVTLYARKRRVDIPLPSQRISRKSMRTGLELTEREAPGARSHGPPNPRPWSTGPPH